MGITSLTLFVSGTVARGRKNLDKIIRGNIEINAAQRPVAAVKPERFLKAYHLDVKFKTLVQILNPECHMPKIGNHFTLLQRVLYGYCRCNSSSMRILHQRIPIEKYYQKESICFKTPPIPQFY
jgi:hypothetical protein